jgi:hypothetical protein
MGVRVPSELFQMHDEQFIIALKVKHRVRLDALSDDLARADFIDID